MNKLRFDGAHWTEDGPGWQMDPRTALPKNRPQAKRLGSRTYFAGMLCVNGHVAERYTGSGLCVECVEDEFR
jgi:hypothetical protein